jgi:uncharacterized protein YqkB
MEFKFLKKVSPENEYYNIYQNIITTYTNVNKYTNAKIPFIGSQPIQLLKENTPILLDYNLVLSPKIDGHRMLLIMNEKGFTFLNRGGEFFQYYNDDIYNNKKWKSKELLVMDTEIYEENGFLQIFVFDIIFGQHDNGKMVKIYKEPYHSRYKILYTLFTNENTLVKYFNNLDPMLKFYHKLTVPYNVAFGEYMTDDGKKSNTYDSIIDIWKYMYNFNDPLYSREIPKFDGVIIINNSYRYFLGPSVQYGQYKWKPSDELTVDLMYTKGKLLDNKGDEWTIPGTNKTATSILKSDIGLIDDNAYEFKFDKSRKLVKVKGPREKGANALMTLNRVYDAIQNPVDLDDVTEMWKVLRSYGSESNLSDNIPKSALQWISKNKAIMFSVLYNTIGNLTFTDDEYTSMISKIIDTYNRKIIELLSEREPTIALVKKASYYDAIIEYSKGIETLDLSGEFNNIIDTIEASDHSSKKVPTSSAFDIIIDISRLYETGYKFTREQAKKSQLSETELSEMDTSRFINLGLKLTDARDLLYKMKKHNYVITEEREIEFVSQKKVIIRGVERVMTENYIYEYNKHLPDGSDTKYILKHIEPDRRNFFNVENSTLLPFTGYNTSFECFETKRMKITGDRKMLRNPSTLFGVVKKRFKEIHTIPHASKYYKLRIIIMKEFSKVPSRDAAGNIVKDLTNNVKLVWGNKVVKKAFIEIVFNYDSFVVDNGLYYSPTSSSKSTYVKGKRITKEKQYYSPQSDKDELLTVVTDYINKKGKPKSSISIEMIFKPIETQNISDIIIQDNIRLEENKKKAFFELKTDTNIVLRKLFNLIF